MSDNSKKDNSNKGSQGTTKIFEWVKPGNKPSNEGTNKYTDNGNRGEESAGYQPKDKLDTSNPPTEQP